jgi:hypothetical protein
MLLDWPADSGDAATYTLEESKMAACPSDDNLYLYHGTEREKSVTVANENKCLGDSSSRE